MDMQLTEERLRKELTPLKRPVRVWRTTGLGPVRMSCAPYGVHVVNGETIVVVSEGAWERTYEDALKNRLDRAAQCRAATDWEVWGEEDRPPSRSRSQIRRMVLGMGGWR